MYYWLQTVTPLGTPQPTFIYGSDSKFMAGTTNIFLSDGDANSYTAPYGVNNPLEGIDNFAWTVMHESQHYKDWLDCWDNDAEKWANEHYGNSGRNDDKDGDMIPNNYEDVNFNQVYDSVDLYDWQIYNTPTPNRPDEILNDFEDWNCKRHTTVRGNHLLDWSNPGMQHKTIGEYND